MTDRVLVPLPGIGALALDVDVFRTALPEGAKLGITPTASTAPAAPPAAI